MTQNPPVFQLLVDYDDSSENKDEKTGCFRKNDEPEKVDQIIVIFLFKEPKNISLPKSELGIKFWKRSRQTKQISGTLVMNIDIMLFSTKPNSHKERHNDVVDLNTNHRQKVLVDG